MFEIGTQANGEDAPDNSEAEFMGEFRVIQASPIEGSIVHELAQPLAAVTMHMQACLNWLRCDPPQMAAAMRSAEDAIRGTLRANEIVEWVREYFGNGRSRLAPVDLPHLLGDLGALLRDEFLPGGIDLMVEYRSSISQLEADPVGLRQVLTNLIANSVHAMNSGGTANAEITVVVEDREGGGVRISVADRGPGLSEDVLPQIFVPNFTTRHNGLGLGLAICRSIVEAHGGHITARNGSAGGAVFSFDIPQRPRHHARTADRFIGEDMSRSDGSSTIA